MEQRNTVKFVFISKFMKVLLNRCIIKFIDVQVKKESRIYLTRSGRAFFKSRQRKPRQLTARLAKEKSLQVFCSETNYTYQLQSVFYLKADAEKENILFLFSNSCSYFLRQASRSRRFVFATNTNYPGKRGFSRV